MITKYHRFVLPALTAVCLLGAAGSAHAQYAYDIVGLGSLGPSSYPRGLNNQGQIVGAFYSPQDKQSHAFLYSDGTLQDLFAGQNTGSTGAVGINDRGQITGVVGSGPFVYDLKTHTQQGLGLGVRDVPYGINQNGDITGSYKNAITATHAFLYSTSTGNFRDISNIIGDSLVGYALNNAGQVAGDIAVLPDQLHAFYYSDGVIHDIGTLPGGGIASARGINDSGEVVGYSDATGVSYRHAFLYQNGQMQDLGLLQPNDFDSAARGINNAGDIVGASGYAGFLYHNGTMQRLDSLIDPSLGWNISDAYAINDRGQITGIGSQGMFLMTPHVAATPAPGSLLVCGLGGGLLLLRLRRKKRSRR